MNHLGQVNPFMASDPTGGGGMVFEPVSPIAYGQVQRLGTWRSASMGKCLDEYPGETTRRMNGMIPTRMGQDATWYPDPLQYAGDVGSNPLSITSYMIDQAKRKRFWAMLGLGAVVVGGLIWLMPKSTRRKIPLFGKMLSGPPKRRRKRRGSLSGTKKKVGYLPRGSKCKRKKKVKKKITRRDGRVGRYGKKITRCAKY